MIKRLTSERPRSIGILSPLAGGFYFGDIIAGAEAAARRHGARVIVAQASFPWPERAGPPRPAPYIPLAWEHIDGFVVVVDALAPDDLLLLTTTGKPIVTLSMPNVVPDAPAVLPDNHGGALEAVRHLIAHGHRRIAFAGCRRQEDLQQRYEGYLEALAEHGIAPDAALCFATADNLEEGGREAATALLAAGLPCTAIFVGTDRNTLGLMEAVQAAGYRVPDDLAIVSFDDMELAQQAVPALSSVRQRFDALGELAAEHLLASIAGEAVPAGISLVPTALIRRHSCGCSGAHWAPALPAGPCAGLGWRETLAGQLSQQLIAPLQPAAGTTPAQLWPGVGAVIDALEAAVLGTVAPGATAVDRAWQEAGARTRSAEAFDAIVVLLERAGLALQAQRSGEATMPSGLQAFLAGVRIQILRSSMTNSLRLDQAHQAVSSISRAFLRRGTHAATDLSWLALASARRACLGLWEAAPGMSERMLRIAGSYTDGRGAKPGSGAVVVPEAFPPADFLNVDRERGTPPAVLLLPLGTPEREWGVLAVVGPEERQFHEGHDAIRHGATELTLALEHEELLRASEEQHDRLRESEERYRQVEDHAPLGLALVALDGRWMRVNRALCEIVGYSEEELLERTFQDITHPDDLGADRMQTQRLLDGTIRTYQIEQRYLHRDGHAVAALLSVSLMRGTAGEPRSFICQIQDISERRRVEEAFAASEARFRALVEGAPLGICLLDENAQFEDVNAAYATLLGYTREELRGQPFAVVLAEEQRDGALATFRAQLNGDDQAMSEATLRCKDGTVRTALGTGIAMQGRDSRLLRAIFVVDITERKHLERELMHVAQHDALTGLPNRALFNTWLAGALSCAIIERPLALLLIDLDRFKEVNDTLGHQAGDDLLCEVAGRLRASLRPADSVARLGGDEFAVLLPETDEVGAVRVADRLRAALDAPLTIAGQRVAVDMSVGVALAPYQASDAATLLRYADLAMYEAKASGGGCAVYREEHANGSPARLGLAADLRRAIGANQLRLHFQPIAESRTGRVERLEALVRWQHPEHGLLPPAQFVPLAEALGLSTPLTLWVLEAALAQCRQWHDEGLLVGVSINAALPALQDSQFPDLVAAVTRRHGLDPAFLTVEVTESVLMTRPAEASAAIKALGDLGVHVAMDDFGTGHSSLAQLQQLPVHELKIDRTFVLQMANGEDDTLMAFVLGLAGALCRTVVAEGVETVEMWERLIELGCDAIQGYYLSRPMPPEAVADWLRAHNDPASRLRDRRSPGEQRLG